jgi:exosortase A
VNNKATHQYIVVSIVLLLAWFGVYFNTLEHMLTVWSNSETYKHCFFIVPISLYLIYEKKQLISRLHYEPVWLMLLPLLGVQAIYVLGDQLSIGLVTHFCAVSSFILIVWTVIGHSAFRVVLFPLLYLYFCVPFGEEFVPQLQIITADISTALLNAVNIPVYREGLYLYLPNGTFHVAEACAGIRFLIGTFSLGVLLAYLNYQTFWKRAVFIFICALVPVIANGIRAFGIMVIGYLSDMKHAVGADHLVYGWFFFLFVLALLFFIGNIGSEPSPTYKNSEASLSIQVKWFPLISVFVLLLSSSFVLSSLSKETNYVSQPLERHLAQLFSSVNSHDILWSVGGEATVQPTWTGHVEEIPVSITYRTDQDDDELVSSLHRAFNEDYFSLVDGPEHRTFNNYAYRKLTIQNVSGNTRTLLVFYKLETSLDASPLRIKWNQLLAKLSGKRADGFYVVAEVPTGSNEQNVIQTLSRLALPQNHAETGRDQKYND